MRLLLLPSYFPFNRFSLSIRFFELYFSNNFYLIFSTNSVSCLFSIFQQISFLTFPNHENISDSFSNFKNWYIFFSITSIKIIRDARKNFFLRRRCEKNWDFLCLTMKHIHRTRYFLCIHCDQQSLHNKKHFSVFTKHSTWKSRFWAARIKSTERNI